MYDEENLSSGSGFGVDDEFEHEVDLTEFISDESDSFDVNSEDINSYSDLQDENTSIEEDLELERSDESEISSIITPGHYEDDNITDKPESSEESEQSIANWITPLEGVVERFSLTEFGKVEFVWNRVLFPDNSTMTDKFIVFKRDIDKNEWSVLNGMISKRYLIASLQSFVDYISPGLDIRTSDVSSDAFHLWWTANINYDVEVFESDGLKTLLSVVTGESVETLNSIQTSLSTVVHNSYDGSSRLGVSYNLKTKVVTGDNQEKTLTDYFSLANYSTRVVHGLQLDQMSNNLTDVENNILANISMLKAMRVEMDSDLVRDVSKCFNEKGSSYLLGLWESIPDPMKTAFYFVAVTSIVAEKHFKINTINRINGIINNLF